MSEVKTETLDLPDDATPRPPRIKVVVHRLDGGLEDGEADARSLTSAGFPIYSGGDSQRARIVPTADIKYVVFGSVDDPTLEPDPGEKSTARKAILRFRDGEWISAYIDQGAQPDGDGIAIKIRLPELQRVIPAVAAMPSLLETQFVEMWTAPAAIDAPTSRRVSCCGPGMVPSALGERLSSRFPPLLTRSTSLPMTAAGPETPMPSV